jgi:DNA (cytosine-5)-methyltransferase 1
MLDLFSGIGGFSLAADSVGIETVAFCEIEPYPTRVLNRHWPTVPVFPDVKELTADALADTECERRQLLSVQRPATEFDGVPDSGQLGQQSRALCAITGDTAYAVVDETIGDTSAARIDIICGGFPCQDLSYAGKGAGLDGDTRSGLYREVVRLAGELRPRWILLENVAALLARGLDVVLGDFAALGYDALWATVPACAVGAPHRRDRVWIVLTDTDADLEAMYAHVLSRLTPFGDERRPTSTASDAWANDLDRSGMSGKHNLGLGSAVRSGDTWPTPSANEDAAGTPAGKMQRMLGNCAEVRGDTPEQWATGSLNPDWCDALMGYPAGYTLPDGEPMRGMAARWPAGLGAPQHAWEPPRLTTVKEHRAARLKALGNSIVPEVARLWFEAIVAADGDAR